MKGTLTGEFNFIQLTQHELDAGRINNISEDDVIQFYQNEEIEILKVINTNEFLSGTAYVVYSPRTLECITVDSMFVELKD